MQPKRIFRWALAITRETGVEELAMFDPLFGVDEIEMRVVMMDMVDLNPELKGKLRIVPVVVDVREMTEEEAASLRETRLNQG